MYLIAFLFPPVALLLCRRWFQFIPNLILYILAWIGMLLAILPFIGLPLAVTFWALAAIHAFIVVGNCKKERELAAEKTAVT